MKNTITLLLAGLLLIITAMYFANHQEDVALMGAQAPDKLDHHANHSTLVCQILDCSPQGN